MAFRVGQNGHELWPECFRLGVAAIEYTPVDDLDLSRHTVGEPVSAWSRLSSPQFTSLKRFIEGIQEGDTIYVKKGVEIVGKGSVVGPYRFDRRNRIKDPNGVSWQHQRKVNWVSGFPPIKVTVGRQQVMTLVPLEADDEAKIEQAARSCFAEESDIEGTKTEVHTFRRIPSHEFCKS